LNHVASLRCLICGRAYGPHEVSYVCPLHGDEGILDVQYDYAAIGRETSPGAIGQDPDRSIWRYRPLLPIRRDIAVPPLQIGWTPLYKADRLGAALGLRDLWAKDDGRQPTASFKDRASAIAVVKAHEKRAAVVTTASTGNAAAALSGICASVGQRNVIFVPQSAPPAKVAQLLAYGSTVLLVRGTYDDAFELCLKAAHAFGWYNRNTGYNPYMTEGKKTASLEICEQLALALSGEAMGGRWVAPDAILVSVGDGCIIGGMHKGLKDLQALGWIDKMPRLIGVQASGSAALHDAWRDGTDAMAMQPIDAHTIADSISAGLPRDRIKALAAVRETGGAYVTVTDEQILAAIPVLAQGSGIFAEPAGAAAYAGLLAALHQGLVRAEERIVLMITGNGLKDVASARKAVGEPLVVDANLDSVKSVLPKDKTS
jgi:threonine synthase